MASAAKLIRNLYRDSVSLMQLSATLAALPGIEQASAVMATPANLALLAEAGLERGRIAPGPNDLLIAVRGRNASVLESALASAVADLDKPPPLTAAGGPAQTPLRSLQMGLAQFPQANVALISTPGEYAAAEAMKALRLGLNAMLFSDNVDLHDEIELKRYAQANNLLLMGPDCGTAIIGGVPLGFANAVRRGAIGVVGASGTGTQQVTCLAHRQGAGISHAIGTGSHDLHQQVGGITMFQGIRALAADRATKVIVLVSKPPAPEVARKVLGVAKRCGKPVVVNFVGAAPESIGGRNLHAANTLEHAALAAVALSRGRRPPREYSASQPGAPPAAHGDRMSRSQRYVRGLYSGGTFCYEASALLGAVLGKVWSNAPVDPKRRLANVRNSKGHTLIDLGDDEFTRGRPHPMIDFRLRNERILSEGADPEVAVILLDVVLGFGAHPDPAAELVPVIEKAQAAARRQGRDIAFVGFVCGTELDPQGLERQEDALRAAGVLLTGSNAQAVRLAASIAGARR
ncbi:MAG: acyl-CoA synthetase FdrA [Betaproteobacteria bacterium]|nr:acyl-CoA synthetase FdrA [Betaproteobacteria bacterium]